MKKQKPTKEWPIRNAHDADALPDGSVTCGGNGMSYFTRKGEGWREAGYEGDPLSSDELMYPRMIISVPAHTHITLAIDNTQALDVKKAASAIRYAGEHWGSEHDQGVLDRLNESGYDIVRLAA